MDPVQFRLTQESGGCNHGKTGNKALKLLLGGADKQLVDEKILAGQLIDDPYGKPVGRIRPGKTVEYKQFPTLEIGTDFAQNGIKTIRRNRHVDLAPVDLIMDLRLIYHEAIIRGSAGILPGLHNKRTAAAQAALSSRNRFFDQSGRFQIAIYLFGIQDSQILQKIVHESSPFSGKRLPDDFSILFPV